MHNMVNVLHQLSPVTLVRCNASSSPPTPSSRGISEKTMVKCSFDNHILTSQVKHALSGIAASIFVLSQTNQVGAAVISYPNNICQIASAADKEPTLPIDQTSDGRNGKFMMMRGMTAKDFDPVRYSGRWFEVASLKRGFAGQGQEDCHCTQGVYTFDMEAPSIQVDTFCVHGGPDGYITGIRGKVQCLPEEELENSETDLEKLEMIKQKCYLRFPTLPFIPKEPYDVIATDYDNFSLVSGAKDRSFVQIYSRTPDPGPAFIEKYKSYLVNYGYDPSKIKDTPQDCEVMSNSKLAAMMSMSGMQQALTNQFPDLELKAPIELNPFTSLFDTFKKLVELYFKQSLK
ncbi:chloroplastic lipocalin [Mangifera indica]|uniref:chloroplastic lipocalin n=1 Tax=Mangifera indica TaxID=29780 RepID=UPI001CF95F36|nr:chloroplastic lipocalin [Mangifera indica]